MGMMDRVALKSLQNVVFLLVDVGIFDMHFPQVLHNHRPRTVAGPIRYNAGRLQDRLHVDWANILISHLLMSP